MQDLGLIPGLGRSSGEWKCYPLQYSGLENSMDCIFHGVAKSQTGLSEKEKKSLYADYIFHQIHRRIIPCDCIDLSYAFELLYLDIMLFRDL